MGLYFHGNLNSSRALRCGFCTQFLPRQSKKYGKWVQDFSHAVRKVRVSRKDIPVTQTSSAFFVNNSCIECHKKPTKGLVADMIGWSDTIIEMHF
jgi:hypothetical protein